MQKRRAFTLIELLVCIVILVVLLSLLIPLFRPNVRQGKVVDKRYYPAQAAFDENDSTTPESWSVTIRGRVDGGEQLKDREWKISERDFQSYQIGDYVTYRNGYLEPLNPEIE